MCYFSTRTDIVFYMLIYKLRMRYFYIEGILLPTVGFFGLVANTAGVLYLGKQALHQQRFYGLMVVLAIVDTFLIASFFFTFSFPVLADSYTKKTDWPYVLWTYPILHILSTASIYITLALSMDRYLAICKALYYHAHPWPKRFFIIPILCFSIIYNLPRFFELKWTTTTKMENGTNVTSQLLGPTEMRINRYYVEIYILMCKLMSHVILPFFLLITLNCLTYKEMRKYKGKANGDIQEEQKRRIQVYMAEFNIVIVIFFVLCHSIHLIPTICELTWVSKLT